VVETVGVFELIYIMLKNTILLKEILTVLAITGVLIYALWYVCFSHAPMMESMRAMTMPPLIGYAQDQR
jgi:hypothetical protein